MWNALRCGGLTLKRITAQLAWLLVACTAAETSRDDSAATLDTVAVAAVDRGAPLLEPRDEANESFRLFRAEALRKLAARDTTYLYGMLAPEIRNSFGPDDSVSHFKRIWKMEESRPDVWMALIRVLTMGGQQPADSTFTAPYVYAFWPDSIDAFEHVAVVGNGVRVQESPGANGREVGRASNSILKFVEWQGMPESGVAADTTWVQVLLPNGTRGWIRGASVYSPVSWRAMFARRDGRWRMLLFVAGD